MRRFFSVQVAAAAVFALAACGTISSMSPRATFEDDLVKLGYNVINVTFEDESGEDIIEASVGIDDGGSLECTIEFERKIDETDTVTVGGHSMTTFYLDEIMDTSLFSSGSVDATGAPDSPSLEETQAYLREEQAEYCLAI